MRRIGMSVFLSLPAVPGTCVGSTEDTVPDAGAECVAVPVEDVPDAGIECVNVSGDGVEDGIEVPDAGIECVAVPVEDVPGAGIECVNVEGANVPDDGGEDEVTTGTGCVVVLIEVKGLDGMSSPSLDTGGVGVLFTFVGGAVVLIAEVLSGM